jgi:hypothetical protein
VGSFDEAGARERGVTWSLISLLETGKSGVASFHVDSICHWNPETPLLQVSPLCLVLRAHQDRSFT